MPAPASKLRTPRLAEGRCFGQIAPVNRVEADILSSIFADPATLIPFILIGFAAQLVDGALGMAYGQISSTLLISMGVQPKLASAGVHAAETFTTAVSAASHVAHRNVDWWLFFKIVVPGVIGGILGAYVLTEVPAGTAKPVVLAYLTALGLLSLLSRHDASPHRAPAEGRSRRSASLADSSMQRVAAAGVRSSRPICWSRAAIRVIQ